MVGEKRTKFHNQQILHFRLKDHKTDISLLCQEEKISERDHEGIQVCKKEEEETKIGFCAVDFHSSIA